VNEKLQKFLRVLEDFEVVLLELIDKLVKARATHLLNLKIVEMQRKRLKDSKAFLWKAEN